MQWERTNGWILEKPEQVWGSEESHPGHSLNPQHPLKWMTDKDIVNNSHPQSLWTRFRLVHRMELCFGKIDFPMYSIETDSTNIEATGIVLVGFYGASSSWAESERERKEKPQRRWRCNVAAASVDSQKSTKPCRVPSPPQHETESPQSGNQYPYYYYYSLT